MKLQLLRSNAAGFYPTNFFAGISHSEIQHSIFSPAELKYQSRQLSTTP